MVAPSCDRAGTAAVAERIRKSISAPPIETDDGPVTFTVSCGIAVSEATEPLDAKQLLQSADLALYHAKELGRNRTEFATQAPLANSG